MWCSRKGASLVTAIVVLVGLLFKRLPNTSWTDPSIAQITNGASHAVALGIQPAGKSARNSIAASAK